MPHANLTLAPGAGYTVKRNASQDDCQDDEPQQCRIVKYRWTQFHGQEQVTEFDLDSHLSLDGHFECNSSAGHKEYQDRLRTIHFREEGKTKSEIATVLGRSEKFVAKWWQKTVKEVPRPYGVHAYLSFDNGGVFGEGAQKSENSAMDASTHWRDVELRRGFASDPAVYQELLQNCDWKQAPGSTTRDFRTGARHLKYDKEGNIRMQGYMRATYKPGQAPALDHALQKLFATYGIEDRTSGVLLNYYEDGKMMLGSHRHDCWTALFSFGANRILTIDNTPILCQDGDLINFGTQRHGVPLMPQISEGRITVPVFFYPDKLQKQAMWQTITDTEEAAPSAKLAQMQSAARLSGGANEVDLWHRYGAEISHVCQLGFSQDLAMDALVSHDFNVEKALQVLCEVQGDVTICPCECAGLLDASDVVHSTGTGRWRNKSSAKVCIQEEPPVQSMDLPMTEEEAAGEALALAMHLEEMENPKVSDVLQAQFQQYPPVQPMNLPMTEEEAAGEALALAMHFEEMDKSKASDVLQAQFQQYETEIDRLDAEDGWGGTSGDLMATRRAQAHLTLQDMDKATVFSVGHGDLRERDFFEVLQLNSVRVLYDTRPTDYRHELVGVAECYSVRNLKLTCKNRGIFYKQMVVGRESAYGTLAHLRSDQGKHILIELAWQAKRKSTAFLGRMSDWRQDPRLAIAQELCTAGHRVEHILSDGSCEEHVKLHVLPDWLSTEEERLRKLEKKRQSGELQRPQKSAVDRSSEAIASHAMRPAQEIDAMAALKDAENQPELKIAQQKLARIQRIAEKKELPNKVLMHAPGFIKEEAHAQVEWIAQRKHEKQKKTPPQPQEAVTVEAPSGDGELQVECIRCGILQCWSTLQGGDGVCPACSNAQLGSVVSHSVAPETSGTETQDFVGSSDLFVECQKCGTAYSWSVLALGDGLCSRCFEEREELACNTISNSQSSSSKRDIPQSAQLDSSVDAQLPLLGITSLHSEASTDIKAEVSNATSVGNWRARRRAKAS